MNKEHINFYEVLKMDKERDILIIDPFAINMADIKEIGIKNVLRIRRPFWGQGNLSEFINKVNPEEFKLLLRELIDAEKK